MWDLPAFRLLGAAEFGKQLLHEIATRAKTTIALAIAMTPYFTALGADQASRPNIVLILTDDQGYGDLSCHGNPVLKTPNLDRLHTEGVRFTNFQVSPTCAPTRSALLTGRHEFRNGITHTILERERLTLDAVTLAETLKSAGYATGIFGKWHLGDETEYRPDRRGFDEAFIHGAGGIGQSYPGSCGDAPGNTYFSPAIYHNGRFEKTDGYCTDVFFDRATKWIEAQAPAKGAARKPFYCQIATNAPHAPLQVRPEDEARYKDRVKDADTAKFFGMIANIDDNVGKLLDRLEAWGIEQDTLVVFMNDNGGTGGVKVFNAGMRGSKNSPWQGGTRAASLWRWPGTLAPADVEAVAAHVDFFPTIAALAGAEIPAKAAKQIEGRSLVPLLKDPKAGWGPRRLFTHLGRWPKGADPAQHKYSGVAVREDQWTLVSVGAKPFAPATKPQWQLFDLKTDPGQERNVAEEHPQVVARLAAEYDAWWTSVQPQLVNENVPLAKENPFKTLFEQQFGAAPRKGE